MAEAWRVLVGAEVRGGIRRDSVRGMKYSVALTPTEEGYSVSCPGLPGCWSQGATEAEALANIRDAIREYVEVARELAGEQNLREVEIPV
jgi:predicted RNase H-like HicB family nuclease